MIHLIVCMRIAGRCSSRQSVLVKKLTRPSIDCFSSGMELPIEPLSSSFALTARLTYRPAKNRSEHNDVRLVVMASA